MHGVVSYILVGTPWSGINSLETVDEVAGLPSTAPIVLVDLDGTGFSIDEIRVVRPAARPVALSRDGSGASVLEALRAGARAFVHNPDELLSLDQVLARVADGEVVVPLDLQKAAVQELGRLANRVRLGVQADARLTSRERQVLDLLADGLTARQIGSTLSISPRTVERHAHGLYRKLDARTRVQAVTRAAAVGLVEPR
jgi:two-component system nitrate/nitrite response regulator NarL